jgi:hypothetical protein
VITSFRRPERKVRPVPSISFVKRSGVAEMPNTSGTGGISPLWASSIMRKNALGRALTVFAMVSQMVNVRSSPRGRRGCRKRPGPPHDEIGSITCLHHGRSR